MLKNSVVDFQVGFNYASVCPPQWMLFLEPWIITSRLIIDDKIGSFYEKKISQNLWKQKFWCLSHIHLSLSLIWRKHKLEKHRNIRQILGLKYFHEMVPSFTKNHYLLLKVMCINSVIISVVSSIYSLIFSFALATSCHTSLFVFRRKWNEGKYWNYSW